MPRRAPFDRQKSLSIVPPSVPCARLTARRRCVVLIVAAVFLCGPVAAQHCDNIDGADLGIDPGATGPDVNACGFVFPDFCDKPTNDPPFYVVGDTSIQARFSFGAGGNHQQATNEHVRLAWFSGPDPPQNCDVLSCTGALEICGNSGNEWFTDFAEAWIEIGRPACEDLDTAPGVGVYSASIVACFHDPFGGCLEKTDVAVDLSPEKLGELLECDAQPDPPMDNPSSCPLNGASGNANAAGTGPRAVAGGPGATLRYAAGGAGAPGLPGSNDWTETLGRFWSHDYAQRIVETPDETHVWLITADGLFREFTDLVSGIYQTNSPSDEYRTLAWLGAGAGWELRDLDGTVVRFDGSGRWSGTIDRNGNRVVAAYTDGRLTGVSFPDGRREELTYAPSGKLESIVEWGVRDLASRVWTYTWSGDDLRRIDRPDGTARAFSYDDPDFPGYLTRMELVGRDGGRRVEKAWEIDDEGRVTKTWRGANDFDDPAAVDRYSLIFVSATETEVTDPLGDTATFTIGRDERSNRPKVLSVSGDCPVCDSGPNSQFFYEDPDHPLLVTRQIDGEGVETAFTYNADGRMLTRTEAVGTPLERTTTWAYDEPGFPGFQTAEIRESVLGAPATRETAFAFDPVTGDLDSRTITGFENGEPFSYTTRMLYNDSGKPRSIDPPGYGTDDVTSFEYYDDRGDLLVETRTDPIVGDTEFTYDPFNRTRDVTDPNGVTTRTLYDALNRPTRTIAGFDSGQDLVTENVYNEFGDLFRTTLPRGNLLEYGYDGSGRLRSIERKPDAGTLRERTLYTLDDAGNRIKEELQIRQGGQWVNESFTDFVYETRCRLDRIVYADGTVTEHDYDCEGKLERVWDANHPSNGQSEPATTFYGYDVLDRLETVTVPWAPGGNAVTTYGYDVQDHLTSVLDAEGNLTEYEYSDRDLLTEERSPVSGATNHRYNPHGELTDTLDARGTLVRRTIDPLDRVTFVDYTDAALDTTYTYDELAPGSFPIGRLSSITRVGQSIDYRYDRFGRVTRDGLLGYQYDANGNRTGIRYPEDFLASYEFDYADRPQRLRLMKGQVTRDLVTDAVYKSFGPLANLAFGSGLAETRGYDARYFPQTIDLPGRLSWTYATDALGNVETITDNLNPGGSRAYGYQDFHYFLTQGNGPWGTQSWTYDRIGNRLTETKDGATDTYAYPSNGTGNLPQLSTITRSDGATITYGYDDAGNQEETMGPGARTRDFLFDDANRLAGIRGADPIPRTTHRYDGRSYLGFAELDNGNFQANLRPTYSSEGALLHTERTLSNPEIEDHHRFVFYFGARPVATLDADENGAGGFENFEIRYLTTDHLGTPVVATNATGTELWEGGFEPFGGDFSGAEDAGVFLRFPGQWNSDEIWDSGFFGNEVYYNVHRWYDPQTGRYGRADPLGLPGSSSATAGEAKPLQSSDINLYSYAVQNPTIGIDPLGLAVQVLGCGSRGVAKIQSAAAKADAASQTCLPCPDKGLFRKKIRGNDLKIKCVSSSFNPSTGSIICGKIENANTIVITPFGFQEVPGCGCLQATVLHEVLHTIGKLHDDGPRFKADKKCFSCS